MILSLPRVKTLLQSAPPAFTSVAFYVDALIFATVVSFGGLLVGFTLTTTLPRLLALAIKPGRTYPLYGWHYWAHRWIGRLTNSVLLTGLSGDSSYIVHYLRAIGYNLCRVEQSGSNFGMEVRHETPYHATVGTGTMVADGLSIANAEYSNTSFRVSPAAIGPHNFLGNHILYPAGGKTGDNCLLATKVMVPVDGPIREGVGLLGSPAFEIPRTVERDTSFDHLKEEHLITRLPAKNRHNLRSMGLYLFLRWATLLSTGLVSLAGLELSDAFHVFSVTAALLLNILLALFLAAFFERASTGFGRMSAQFCSIYDPYFWWHERSWKLHMSPRLLNLLNGTPFKPLLWRMLGVRIGAKVFDDGCIISERTLTTIGAGCTLNAGAIIQCHSQEDGAFKSAPTTVGANCTLGVGSLVHYGVTVGDGAVVATDSFVMKGEDAAAGSLWGGNPAHEVRTAAPLPTGVSS